LHTPTNEEIAAKEAQERKEAEDKISPKAHAAKMGMYGSLTREKKPWQPARLLCKRFGVKDPNPEPEIVSDPAVAASSSTATASFTHSELQKAGGSRPVADTTTPMQTRDGPRDLANIGLGEDEMQGQDTLTYERPSMDIFKAIFASDDEDSEQEEREPEEDNEVTPFPTTKDSRDGFTPATVIFDDSPVDINTFKPTFIPREGKSNKPKKEDKSKHKKDKKRKEKQNVLVSFEMEGDGAEGAELRQPKDRPKKKRKDKIDIRGDDNEQAGWAAPKSPPSGLPQPSPSPAQTITPSAEREPKGRKRAIDFM
jgi:G patch domain-containing protein 1